MEWAGGKTLLQNNAKHQLFENLGFSPETSGFSCHPRNSTCLESQGIYIDEYFCFVFILLWIKESIYIYTCYTSIRTIVPAKLDLNKSGGCCSNSYRLHILPVHRCKKPCLPVFALLSRFLSFLCLGPKKPVPVPACKKPCCCVNSEKKHEFNRIWICCRNSLVFKGHRYILMWSIYWCHVFPVVSVVCQKAGRRVDRHPAEGHPGGFLAESSASRLRATWWRKLRFLEWSLIIVLFFAIVLYCIQFSWS